MLLMTEVEGLSNVSTRAGGSDGYSTRRYALHHLWAGFRSVSMCGADKMLVEHTKNATQSHAEPPNWCSTHWCLSVSMGGGGGSSSGNQVKFS